MTNLEKSQCANCGAPTPDAAVDQLCAACLLSGALKPSNETATPLEKTVVLDPNRRIESPANTLAKFPSDFGGYRLLGLLGSGGMGTVYEAEQLSTGRRVALKTLSRQIDSQETRQRFLREGRVAAGVNHPNSLFVFGAEEIGGVPVIAMEVASLGTLSDQLKQHGPYPVNKAVDAILGVIDGLEAACEVGILHRDIKPSNCFIGPDGSVKVGDFGLSVSTSANPNTALTATGMVMGTPAYASPEQLRGDDLDSRADIYSVGATFFTLLTGRPPFEGENAVQVVANAIDKKPKQLSEFRTDIPPGLEQVVTRCLAKEPNGRYPNYQELRDSLLPFSSEEAEPASMKSRVMAGWIDYLIAFLAPYVALMFTVSAVEFHNVPFIERTLYSARFYLILFGFGFLYFSIFEGIWGAGLGKRLKGLRVIRVNGRSPGIMRALLRIFIPILSIEVVRVSFLLATISANSLAEWTVAQSWLVIGAANVCPWIAVLLTLPARRENGFATVWDRLTGTRVVIAQKGSIRPAVEPLATSIASASTDEKFGPFEFVEELVPGKWITAKDPVLDRQVWLLRRDEFEPSHARQNVGRHGRLRWLQKVSTSEGAWDAYEAAKGTPFSKLVESGPHIPWSKLRHWLHDLASELWAANGDQTLPDSLSLDHVWITAQGRAVILDAPWPGASTRAELIPVSDLAGQQRFLHAIAEFAESTNVPLQARPALQNLSAGKFEKLSFLTGTLRGLLDKPAEVSRAIRAGSIFMLPAYVWIMMFLGLFQEATPTEGATIAPLFSTIQVSGMIVLGTIALIQLIGLPFRCTASQSIFRLALVNAKGEPISLPALAARWALVWLPLILPTLLVALIWKPAETTSFIAASSVFLIWFGVAIHTVLNPNQGLHDRLTGTWVVRR